MIIFVQDVYRILIKNLHYAIKTLNTDTPAFIVMCDYLKYM